MTKREEKERSTYCNHNQNDGDTLVSHQSRDLSDGERCRREATDEGNCIDEEEGQYGRSGEEEKESARLTSSFGLEPDGDGSQWPNEKRDDRCWLRRERQRGVSITFEAVAMRLDSRR